MIPLLVNIDNIEVNIDYPDVLYDFHNNYPLATEKIKPKNETLSQVKIMEDKNFFLVKLKSLFLIQVIKKIQTLLSRLKNLFKVKITIKKDSLSIRIQTKSIFKAIY